MKKSAREQRKRRKDGGKKGESKDSSVGQRQTATAARLAVARAPLFPPGSLFLFHLILPSLPLFWPRERDARTVGFIVFELDASLFCFVSRAIRGANCRSYAIAFCFLLLPPFLHDPLTVVPALRAPSPPPPCCFARRTPTDTTDHDADREGRLSHSPHSLSSRAFLHSRI